MKTDIVIAGVGGQGNVLASRILARAAITAGYRVRTSEMIGMAQREGMVMSQIRIGEADSLYGAIVPNGAADILLGFELAETVRALPKLKPGGTVITSTGAVLPVSVTMGLSTYDLPGIKGYLQGAVEHLYTIDALALATRAGNYRAANMVLLGALAALDILPYSGDVLLSTVLAAVPDRFKEVNQLAFTLGRQAVGGGLQ